MILGCRLGFFWYDTENMQRNVINVIVRAALHLC